MCLGRRDFPQRRAAATIRESVSLNFWMQPRQVWKAFNDDWRDCPARGRVVERRTTGIPVRVQDGEATVWEPSVGEPFNRGYAKACERYGGPVDIYEERFLPLLAAYMARPNVPVVRVHLERLTTSNVMYLLALADGAESAFVKRSLQAKAGYMLRRRGFPQSGRLLVK